MTTSAGFESGPDETAPVLSEPAASATSASTATASVTTDEGNGTLYGVVTGSATVPSAAQVTAGEDHSGSAAAWSGSAAVFSVGEEVLAPTGLTAATTYYFHAMHEDASGNQSAVVSTASFATWPAIPNTQTFNSSGNWTVPTAADYYTVTVELFGGGGGGGGGGISSDHLAGNGGYSRFAAPTPLVAGGGIGGQGRYYGGSAGAGGTASGGSVNTNGNPGDDGTQTGDPYSGYAIGGAGGDCPNGGAGGAQTGPTSGNAYGVAGTVPGGAAAPASRPVRVAVAAVDRAPMFRSPIRPAPLLSAARSALRSAPAARRDQAGGPAARARKAGSGSHMRDRAGVSVTLPGALPRSLVPPFSAHD